MNALSSVQPPRQPARNWFDRGCDAFKFAFPEIAAKVPYERFYVCPLCLHAFDEQALARRVLTREHVPPENVGGHRLVLTCRRCNSAGGHGSDIHVRREADIYDFASGDLGETRAILSSKSGRVRIRLSASGQGLLASCIPEATSAAVHAAVIEEFGRAAADGTWGEFGFKFDFAPFSRKRAAAGWLRSAYLAFFAALGYRFIVRPEMSVVRTRIGNPELDEPRIFRIIRTQTSEPQLVRIDAPEVFRSYAMFYRRNVVLLPWYGDATLYERLARKPDTAANLSGVQFPWPRGPMFEHDRASP